MFFSSSRTLLLHYFVYGEQVKLVGRGYNEELKWIMGGEMPSFEEYMTNSVIRSCMPMTLSAVVPGCTTATKETLDWLLSEPKILISASKIVRLLDDLATHEVSTSSNFTPFLFQ